MEGCSLPGFTPTGSSHNQQPKHAEMSMAGSLVAVSPETCCQCLSQAEIELPMGRKHRDDLVANLTQEEDVMGHGKTLILSQVNQLIINFHRLQSSGMVHVPYHRVRTSVDTSTQLCSSSGPGDISCQLDSCFRSSTS